MKNKKLYRDIMSNVQPSEQSVERIFEMTVEKKKSNKRFIIKRIASAALALAILVGGSYGANAIISSLKGNNHIVNDSNPLSVMVAYAGEYKPISNIKTGSMNEQSIFYSIHYAYINDGKALAKAEELYESDKAKLESDMNELSNKGSGAVLISGESLIDSIKGEATVRVYQLQGGIIALNIDDYTDIKKMTINNNGFGQLYVNYVTDKDSNVKQQIGNEIEISGDELRRSQASKVFECGTKNIVNKGYELFWDASHKLYKAIGDNPDFDLANIKDIITFTVEFNDGTVKTASLNLYFDSDGYMHLE